MRTFNVLCIAICTLLLCATPSHAAPKAPAVKAVWNLVHGYNNSEDVLHKVTREKLRQIVKDDGVNAVELDMVYHTDRFYAAHAYWECNPGEPRRAELCLALAPLLEEVESNSNITLLWIDPKSQGQWVNEETGATVLLSDLAAYIRQFVKTKPIWWGLGSSGALSRGDIDELVRDTPLPDLEGISYDYAKFGEYSVTIQDMYLRARRANVQHLAYSGNPGFGLNSCDELNKAFSYLSEGKLSRILGWTINDREMLEGLYHSNDSRVTCEVGTINDETQIVGAVEGIISDMYQGIRTQTKVIEADPTLRLATSDDVFWTPRSQFGVEPRHDNVLANGGAEMPPLPNSFASSWRLSRTAAAGTLSITQAECPAIAPSTGNRYFALEARCDNDESRMYQDIVVEAYESEIDDGNVGVTVKMDVFVDELGAGATIGLDVSGDVVARFGVSSNATGGQWVSINETVQLPSGTRMVRLFVATPTTCPASTQATGCPQNHVFVDNVAFMVYLNEQDKNFWSKTATIVLLSITGAAVIIVAIVVVLMHTRNKRKAAADQTLPINEKTDSAFAETKMASVEHNKDTTIVPISEVDDNDTNPPPGTPVLVLAPPVVTIVEEVQRSRQESVFSDAGL